MSLCCHPIDAPIIYSLTVALYMPVTQALHVPILSPYDKAFLSHLKVEFTIADFYFLPGILPCPQQPFERKKLLKSRTVFFNLTSPSFDH